MKEGTIKIYNQLFEMRIANSAEDLERVFRLRYDVYHNEKGWEPENNNQLEMDLYDQNALHALLIYKPTGEALGTVRVVLPHKDDLKYSYPMQEMCDHEMLHDDAYVSRMVEISRMAISKSIRKKIMTNPKLWWHILKSRQSPKKVIADLNSCLSAGLIGAILEMMTLKNMQGAFAVMEPVFIRMLRRVGIRCKLLGKPIEHRGKRQPCYFDLETLIEAQKKDILIYNFISHDGDLDKTLRSFYMTDLNSPFRKLLEG